MHTTLVCILQRWQMEATGLIVSDYMEILSPQTMTGRLYYQGEVIQEYKIDQCDSCNKLVKWDAFGLQTGHDRADKIAWFCGECR